jgi:hypothetical protein
MWEMESAMSPAKSKKLRCIHMENQPPAVADSQLALIQSKIQLDGRIKGGASWFYWIAGLSLINTLAFLFGANFNFLLGLAVTQLVDGFMFGLAGDLGSAGSIVQLIGLAINLGIAGIFVVFGFLGRKRLRWAIIVGMVVYAIDGLLMLLFQEYVSAGFHAFALISISSSLKAISDLASLEKLGPSESIESIRQRMPSLQPEVTPAQRRTRWILTGLIVVAVFIFFVIAMQQI